MRPWYTTLMSLPEREDKGFAWRCREKTSTGTLMSPKALRRSIRNILLAMWPRLSHCINAGWPRMPRSQEVL